MPGKDRILDAATGDYVSDGKGAWKKTDDLRTSVWHQIAGEKEHWVGDVDAGSELWRFRRTTNSPATALAAKDAMVQCLKPFVEQGLAANLVVTTDRDPVGRLTLLTSIHDVSHGPINVAPIKPGGP